MVIEAPELTFAWDILLRPRWYPLDFAVGKLFVGAIVGYGLTVVLEEDNVQYGYYDYYGADESDSFAGVFTIGVEAGWKFVFGKFGLEPWLGYTIGIGDNPVSDGFKIGVSMGFAW
jgi:hypothetical protein